MSESFSQTETAIAIDGPVGQLEARTQAGQSEGPLAGRGLVAVVCHPHPLHGGTMNNKVVTTLMRVYRDLGVDSVRFNFRGVGESGGEFDNARGEVDDLLAVVSWVKSQGIHSNLLLAGFSFGSSVAAQATYRSDWAVQHLTLVAPPVARYPYDQEGRFPCPVCLIQGDQDDVVEPDSVYQWRERIESPLQLLRYPDAGHFFHGGLVTLKKDLLDTLPAQLEGRV
ncbi:alpha/beta hydrolase [Marinimicrobium sp. ABcell2]|uniref:alpha/beta hydrolase n=1 Tax=Marinimicrobium sp. ABcell2 TaxID=3069751 RepID=UPI0027B19816|nr:alpha/beta fold hydrolase [Marinimicrobium sp. ABcell2]MDQ2078260.1 alpha/beta hydrolase [Marinimicrobium sp. ABcell2]